MSQQAQNHAVTDDPAEPLSPHEELPPPDLTGSSRPHVWRFFAIVVLVLVVAGGFSLARRLNASKSLAVETTVLAEQSVSVIKPALEASNDPLVLPGALQAYVDSAIYARTSGYLLKWYMDIGSQVKKGDLLADIDTPEVDQELMQAKAARDQIQAQLELAKTTADRWTALRSSDSVSQQEADQQTSMYKQTQANLGAADANVRRLEELESFKHVYAPFSGILTKRNVDIGALINAGSGQTKELFDLAQLDPLRVFVSLPQIYAPSISIGTPAYLQLQEFPGEKFEGKVVRTSDSIDPSTRTLLTEIDVPNHDNRLLPGAYAQVHFAVPVKEQRMTLPVNALLFRAEGPRAAVVGPAGRIQLKSVGIGHDYGVKVEIISGIETDDRIVLNPSDSLQDGEVVKVADDAAAADKGADKGKDKGKG